MSPTPPCPSIERWQYPLKNLPMKANWIAVQSTGAIYWYSEMPSRNAFEWHARSPCSCNPQSNWLQLFVTCFLGFTKSHLSYGWIGSYKPPAYWEIALRKVIPVERVGYVPEVKR